MSMEKPNSFTPFPLTEVLHTSARAGSLPAKGCFGFAEHGKVESIICYFAAAFKPFCKKLQNAISCKKQSLPESYLPYPASRPIL